MRKKFREYAEHEPRKYAEVVNATNCTGNYIKNAKNCKECFHCYDAEECAYGYHIFRGAKECVDCDTAGRNGELIYNSLTCGLDSSRIISSIRCFNSQNLEYCTYCLNCSDCFGCDALVNKEYCILNAQYSKQEYESITEGIRNELKGKGEYGDFFPSSMSTFGINETAAMEQYPLTQEEARSKGFLWEDISRGTYGKETLRWENAQDEVIEADVNAVNSVFACIMCEKNYRIIPQELAFYKRLEIPLPRLCPDCRHMRRLKDRGPNRLWQRVCVCEKTNHRHSGKCQNEFQTPYAPERPEVVYCKDCYNETTT